VWCSTATGPRGPAPRSDYHVDIKGVDAQGRRYHALNPDVFYWAHSTFFVGTIIVADRLCGGITEDEKRQLFEEHVQWYSMYGMSMRPVPKTWEEFQGTGSTCAPRCWRTTRPPAMCWICASCPSAVRRVDARVDVAGEPCGDLAVLRLVHRRAVRPVGAKTHGLQLVSAATSGCTAGSARW
jgi:hypothetical protein